MASSLRRGLGPLWITTLVVASSCADSHLARRGDAGADAPSDLVADARSDAPIDATSDAGADAPIDLASDGGLFDLSPDAPVDLASDPAADVPLDLSFDGFPDAPIDLPSDVFPDFPPDLSPDAPLDAPLDVVGPVCGNGIVEAGETCDGSCPASCDDRNACTSDLRFGSAGTCDVQCFHQPIVPCYRMCGVCGNGMLDPGETCDGVCPTACDDGDPCTRDVLVGSPLACDVRCLHERAYVCGYDGCCPSNCVTFDFDCRRVAPSPLAGARPKSFCGNGVVEPGELCDGDCPTRCLDDGDTCTDDLLVGTSCTRRCEHRDRTICASGDGCCPACCDASTDADCLASCGNGVVDPGETCDGSCPTTCDDGDPCTVDTLRGRPGNCDVHCVHAPETLCRTGDGCCPAGCALGPDFDCP